MKKKPGKGKKFCPSCDSCCGAMSKQCPECQHEFISKKAVIEATAKKVVGIPNGYEQHQIRSTIYVPSGNCPVTLKEKPSEADVIDWADNVRVFFLKKTHEWLMNHALCYYLTYDFNKNDEEYDRLATIINSLPDVEYRSSCEAEV